MGKFDNKVALVTASTQGIGFAIARRLAVDGAHVIVCSRKKANVDAAVKSLTSHKHKVSGMVCHVGKACDRALLLDMIKQKFGGMDILVSNAGVNPYFGSILSTPESAYDKILDVNVKATFMLIQESVPLLQARGGGSIVIVSSYAGFSPNPLLGIYGVSKTALLGLTKALVPELRDRNIRVNCIAPGLIKTQFSSALLQQGEEAVAAELKIERIGVPDDCAGVASFLCSDDASYITGETVVVAGGVPCRL